MTLYYEPLVAYVRKIPWTVEIRRSPEYDGDDGGGLVRAFFVDRIGRDEVLLAWSRDRCPFRHWVRRVMRNFLLAKLAEVQQAKRNFSKFLSQQSPEESEDPSVDAAFDREFLRVVVRVASERTEQRLRARNRSEVWEAFRERYCRGRSYDELAHLIPGTHGTQAGALARAAWTFAMAVREAISWPGASEDDIDRELQSLLRVVLRAKFRRKDRPNE